MFKRSLKLLWAVWVKNASSVSVVLPGQGHPIISQEVLGNPFAEKVFNVLYLLPKNPSLLNQQNWKPETTAIVVFMWLHVSNSISTLGNFKREEF